MELIGTTLFSEEQLDDDVKKYEPHHHQRNDTNNSNNLGDWVPQNNGENVAVATYYGRPNQSMNEPTNPNQVVSAYTLTSSGQNIAGGNTYVNRWFEPLEGMVKSNMIHSHDHYDNINHLKGRATILREQGFPTPVATSMHSSLSSIKEDLSSRQMSYSVDNNNHTTINGEINYQDGDNHRIMHSVPYFQTNIQSELAQNASNNLKEKGKRKRTTRKRLTEVQKLAHNKIEKKYRININTKIAQLQKMIPWVSDGEAAFEVHSAVKHQNENVPGEHVNSKTRFNKSLILQKAIDYIVYLKNNEQLYQVEIQRLRQENEALRQKDHLR